MPPPRRLLCLLVCLLATLPTLHAHRPFEVTGVGRIHRGQLEFTATVSIVMANYLLRDSVTPETPPIDALNFGIHRAALLRLAPYFYEVHDGPTLLRPEKIHLELNASGEPEFHFVFPLPTTGPLRIRTVGLHAPGTEGSHLVRFFDDDERLLAAAFLGPAPATPELAVPLTAPASAVSAE